MPKALLRYCDNSFTSTPLQYISYTSHIQISFRLIANVSFKALRTHSNISPLQNPTFAVSFARALRGADFCGATGTLKYIPARLAFETRLCFLAYYRVVAVFMYSIIVITIIIIIMCVCYYRGELRGAVFFSRRQYTSQAKAPHIPKARAAVTHDASRPVMSVSG